jgi:hypothetical protein
MGGRLHDKALWHRRAVSFSASRCAPCAWRKAKSLPRASRIMSNRTKAIRSSSGMETAKLVRALSREPQETLRASRLRHRDRRRWMADRSAAPRLSEILGHVLMNRERLENWCPPKKSYIAAYTRITTTGLAEARVSALWLEMIPQLTHCRIDCIVCGNRWLLRMF